MQNENNLKARAYKHSLAVIRFLQNFPDKPIHRSLVDQLMRSATSIGANIVEAKAASSRRDFVKYYEIALKSANETKYWLGLMRDALGADKQSVEKLLQETDELSNILGASLLTLKNKR